MKAEYLVTGGAGFIGSNIVRFLVKGGKAARVLDNLATGNIRNIRDLARRLDFLKGDVRSQSDVRRAVKGVRFVLHLAAMPSVAQSVEDPVGSNAVNADGTLNVLAAAKDAGVERFVFSSSSAVYGDAPGLPKQEYMAPEPSSPYAVQKVAGEYYCRIFFTLYGLQTYALRYFNVFGPRQNPKSQYAAVIPVFISALRRNRSPIIHGDGGQTRDFVYVEDVVRANLACCEARDGTAGLVYNVASGRSLAINDLAERLMRLTGRRVQPVHGPERPGDIRHSQADVSRARELLRWEPRVDLDEGLRHTVDWFTHASD